ncbi:ribonuclease p protein subunit p40 [Anaeramoeba ignava]|uniref:Ribonuclease p protein subunit p40 n=1 Tax=Anaeramoeba ignava TaxID=1746090 RepID=A0A9Q0LQY7_ANAIG|nr:ribonuclease p protein subunit p40 [Anaeramoeba ignava]
MNFLKSNIASWIRSFEEKNQKTLLTKTEEKLIQKHPFFFEFQLFTPKKIEFEKILEFSSYFYYRVKVNMSFFISTFFIENYVMGNSGEISAFSLNPLDRGDSFCQLRLMLCKSTYEKLGLTGKILKFPNYQQKGNESFIVEINLTDVKFRPGNKFYERVLWCFKDRTEDFDCLLIFIEGSKTMPIEFPQEYKPEKKILHFEQNTFQNIQIPNLTEDLFSNLLSNDPEISKQTLLEFYEWIGFLSNNALNPLQKEEEEEEKKKEKQINFPEIYSNLTENIEFTSNNIYSYKLKGFLIPQILFLIIQQMIQFEDFFIINSFGFRDSLISWQNNYHKFNINGENDSTFIFFTKRKLTISFISTGIYINF